MIDVGICNMALGRIGISRYIQSPTENSNEAVTCGIYWDSCRKRVLEALPWTFASRFADLADLGNPPGWWAYRFQYPNDCLKVRAIMPSPTGSSNASINAVIKEQVRIIGESQFIPFQVVENGDGKAIVCGQGGVAIWYTGDITNMPIWTEAARSALAWLMAAEIAGPLSAMPKAQEAAGSAYALAIREAAANDMNEGNPNGSTLDNYSELLDARL